MGCGSSTVGVANPETNGMTPVDKQSPNHAVKNGHTSPIAKEPNTKKKKEKKSTDSNANIESVESNNPVPKSVAFEVAFDDKNLLLKNPPRRLQKLAPLNVPKMTPELLAERQKLAEDKREKELQRRVSASRKSSKRRRELMKAKEFEQQQQLQQGNQIEEQLKMAELKRLAKLEEVRTRQRLKEERAKRAREKAKKLNQDNPDVDLDVEKDDHYNASDDSWGGDGEENHNYFGSPKKKSQRDLHPTASASTVDSFDNAFMRRPNEEKPLATKDDFFDS
ncbi:uncharacterized protein T27F2.1-like [Haliotis rufescens]|uniref:uncharacterized protein T27F2.1-like n=1 Tax=Haliotis rufescens TaxID=6454 RepID=UPI00201ECD05|nr:uncharacterized protein T27F2.1-like [Haliotis rufescens]